MHRSVLVIALCTAACGDNHGGNTAPTVGDLSVTTAEDTPVMGTLSVVDAEGDNVTIDMMQAQHGTVTKVGSTFTYTPDADYNGPDSFTVTVSDGTSQDTGTVSITVTPVNDAPVGAADSFATELDEPHQAQVSDLLANDTDVDGDTLTITAVSDATNGTVAIAGTDVVFTPTSNFIGSGSYHYTVSDGTLTADVTVTVTVGGVNSAPVAVDDTATTDEDTDLVVTAASLAGNDTDVDGQTLSVTAVANGTGGTVALASGDVTFTPAANFNGTATFTYTVSDGALMDTGTVTVTVAAVNDAPVAVDDAATTDEDTAVTVTQATMVANDTDVDTGTTLTVTGVLNAVNGAVSLGAGGDATFTPTANFNGTASYDYTVSDGAGGTDTGTVTVTIAAVNDAPVAVDDTRMADEDVAATFASSLLVANDIDIDGDALAVTSVSNAVNGSVSLDVSGDITFTPNANFNGTASFDYVVGDGNLSDTGSVTMIVNPLNDAPVANADSGTAESAVPTDFAASTFLANDTDLENDTLTITAVANASDGATVSLSGTTITYTSAAAFTGPATFEYTISDGAGGTATGIVNVNVIVANVCGDGNVFGTEACDDDDLDPGDGCSATCTVEVGWTCTGNPSTCTPICGDNMVVGTEPCDDGNPTDGDGCDTNCTPTGCGNTIVTTGEDCDDGDLDDTDGCTNDCNAGVVCTAAAFAGGDRFDVDPVTGNCYVAFDTDMTTFAQAQASCVVAGGYLATITSTGEQSIITNVQNMGENPWIGGTDAPIEGSFLWLTSEPFTFTNFVAPEPDDDVGLGGEGDCLHLRSIAEGEVGTWGDTNCNIDTFVVGRICEFQVEPCGDGIVQPGEECEGGAFCSATCQLTDGCGDGNIDAGEECDDDDATSGDGCSSTCTFERYFIFTFTGAAGNEATFPADGALPAGLASIPTMSRGPGVTPTATSNVFTGNNWATTFDATDYYSFTVTPAASTSVNLLRLIFGEQRSSSGPTTYVVRSSLDGFTSDLLTGATATSLATHTITLGAQFQNVSTPVEFRIFAFGSTLASGTFRIDNVEVTGGVAP